MAKKRFTIISIFALIGLLFVLSPLVFGAMIPTGGTVQDVAPSFTAGPSDGGSSATTPTLVGGNVNFTATATDPNGEQYYLIICKTSTAFPGDDTEPGCVVGQFWAVSAATNSGEQATAFRQALVTDPTSNVWYAFVCDKVAGGGACSSASQGTGDTGSPFDVNHAPTFGTVTVTDTSNGTIEPGDTLRFTLPNAQIDDIDSAGAQDTISMYVCTGATTAFDYGANTCTGGSLICSATGVDPTTSDATCDETGNTLVPTPTMDGGYPFRTYVKDSHGTAGAGSNYQTYAVADVLATMVSGSEFAFVTSPITLATGSQVSVTFSARFQDNNGEADIAGGDGVLFDADTTTSACSTDERNCVIVSNCTLNAAYGTNTQAEIQCPASLWFNANASSNWEMHTNLNTDAGRKTDFPDSNINIQVQALSGISVAESVIAYGSLAVGGTSSGQTITFENLGNQTIDVLISGTDMTYSTYSIPMAQQKFHHTSATFDWDDTNPPTMGFALVETPNVGCTTGVDCADANGCLNRDLAVRPQHYNASGDEPIYWKIRIPSTQASGSYTGTVNVASTSVTSCTGTLY